MPATSVQFRRTIWILWLQGFASAPFVVRQCLASWKRHNPHWEIVELDEDNLGDWLDVEAIVSRARPDLSPQALSDIVRINLLATYGGVWVDATSFCCKGLDAWLPQSLASGFFAFQNPGPDRLLCSWLMASTDGCDLTIAYRDAVNAYWQHNEFANQRTWIGRHAVRRLSRLLNVNSSRTRWWFSRPVTKGLRVYPYYWFHYLLAEVIRRDRRSRAIWDRRMRYVVTDPFRARRIEGAQRFAALLAPLSATLKEAFDSGNTPVLKLSFKKLPGVPPAGSTLDYLFNATGPVEGQT